MAVAPATLEASPPAATGILKIGTQQWVEVHVDGARLGRAPDRGSYALAPGRHRLRAFQPDSGCSPHEEEITIVAGETTAVRVSLDCRAP